MTSPAPACASDASLDENRIPFFFGPASFLIPFLIFALLSVYLFIVLKVFDLMALAGAGLTALVAGALLTQQPMRSWKAVLEGAAAPMTATVLLLLMAAGVFSAMMKAAGLAEALAAFMGGAIAGTPLLTPAVFLISSLLATATGSSISTILAASPIFLPFGAALGCDVPLMAGAILSGAIFGDNLAPVSDVAIISAMTQTDKFGKPLDLGRVVKTRFPFAVIALIIALPFYALGGSASEPSAALNAAADPMRLLMLIPVVLLIYIAIKMRDALHAVTMATVAGLIIGLLTGVIEPSQIVRVENGSISGILTGGIANVSGIMLMCLALFGFTGVIEHAGLADATAKFLTNENQSPRRSDSGRRHGLHFHLPCRRHERRCGAGRTAGRPTAAQQHRSVPPRLSARWICQQHPGGSAVFGLLTHYAFSRLGAGRPVPHAVFFDDGHVLSHCAFRRILSIDRHRHRTS